MTLKLGFGCLHSGIRILCMLVQSICLLLLINSAGATVIVTTPSNTSLPFSDMESAFTPRVPQAGIAGLLYLSNPLNACEPLRSGPILDKSPFSTFVIAERGICTFYEKVRNAQDAGFSAVIVFNDQSDQDLITMSGETVGINIPAVFVSRAAGLILSEYAGDPDTRCYIFPAMDYPAWSVMAVAFISLLTVTAVLAAFFFVRRNRLRRLGSRLLQREPPGLSPAEVKALPIIIYSEPAMVDQSTAKETCVICMDGYEPGEKLRRLPCRHVFHAACVDQWLLTRKPFCPFCKRDAHAAPMTETTPLLRPPVVSSAATQTSPLDSSGSISVPPPPPAARAAAAAGLQRCSSLGSSTHLTGSSDSERATTSSSWPRSNADLLV